MCGGMQAPDAGRFLKGLLVVDDVAYFGIAASAPRSARHDAALDCELGAFHLVQLRLLWRKKVPLPAQCFAIEVMLVCMG